MLKITTTIAITSDNFILPQKTKIVAYDEIDDLFTIVFHDQVATYDSETMMDHYDFTQPQLDIIKKYFLDDQSQFRIVGIS